MSTPPQTFSSYRKALRLPSSWPVEMAETAISAISSNIKTNYAVSFIIASILTLYIQTSLSHLCSSSEPFLRSYMFSTANSSFGADSSLLPSRVPTDVLGIIFCVVYLALVRIPYFRPAAIATEMDSARFQAGLAAINKLPRKKHDFYEGPSTLIKTRSSPTPVPDNGTNAVHNALLENADGFSPTWSQQPTRGRSSTVSSFASGAPSLFSSPYKPVIGIDYTRDNNGGFHNLASTPSSLLRRFPNVGPEYSPEAGTEESYEVLPRRRSH